MSKDIPMTQSEQADAAADTAPDAKHPRIDPQTVIGWGVDADPENDPTYPMRDRSKDDGPGMNWTPPVAQVADVEILQSVEYGRRPATVGQSTPPSGLSGRIRRSAFAYSESQWGHWLLLMLADRVNFVEGIVEDLGKGTLPNPVAEMGLVKSSNARVAGVATLAVAGLAVFGLVTLLRGHDR
jgi:hypothetical protein